MNYEGTIFVTTRKRPMEEKGIEEKRERDVCGSQCMKAQVKKRRKLAKREDCERRFERWTIA